MELVQKLQNDFLTGMSELSKHLETGSDLCRALIRAALRSRDPERFSRDPTDAYLKLAGERSTLDGDYLHPVSTEISVLFRLRELGADKSDSFQEKLNGVLPKLEHLIHRNQELLRRVQAQNHEWQSIVNHLGN